MQPPESAPRDQQQLLQRAENIAGYNLGELATLANIRVPENFKREKGWTGQLLELWLGAEAGSKPQQDFPELGIELKTIPIDELGRPIETTYVCYAHLKGITGLTWQNSNVRNKLRQVLWIPIQGERHIPPAERFIGMPILWSPTIEQEQALQQDWEELMDMISLGEVEQINASIGSVLQIRPKAADGSALTQAIGKEGTLIQTRPRGFYLRKEFTRQILQQYFAI